MNRKSITETNDPFLDCVSARQSGLRRCSIRCISQGVGRPVRVKFPNGRERGPLPQFPNRKSHTGSAAVHVRCTLLPGGRTMHFRAGDVTRAFRQRHGAVRALMQSTRTTRLSNFDNAPLCGGFQIFTSSSPAFWRFLGRFMLSPRR